MARRARPQGVVAALAAVGGVALLLASVWTGVSYAAPAPITDYANYPPPFPATCTVDGAAVTPGVQFTVDGQTSDNLGALPIVAGSTVTMTWSGFAPGCEGLGIGLSLKYALEPTFDPADDQHLHSFTYCGPEGPLCTTPGSLTLTMPAASEVPCGQLDAHIGPPLATVGPSGAFYSLGHEQNMLISAWNGGTLPCDYEVCPTNPNLPAGSLLCTNSSTTPTTTPTTTPPTTSTTVPTTVTTPPTTATTAPQTTTTAPQTTTTAPPTTTTAAVTGATVLGARVSAGGTGTAAAGGTSATIPVTGSESRPQALVAGLLLLAGAPLALLFRRRPGKHFAS